MPSSARQIPNGNGSHHSGSVGQYSSPDMNAFTLDTELASVGEHQVGSLLQLSERRRTQPTARYWACLPPDHLSESCLRKVTTITLCPRFTTIRVMQGTGEQPWGLLKPLQHSIVKLSEVLSAAHFQDLWQEVSCTVLCKWLLQHHRLTAGSSVWYSRWQPAALGMKVALPAARH